MADVNIETSGHVKLPPGITAGPDGVVRTKFPLVLVKENAELSITEYHNLVVTPLPPNM